MAIAGKGIFIWRIAEIYGGNVTRIADEAQAAGFSHVLVKVADGRYRYNLVNGIDLGAQLIALLRARSIQAWGWQYVYGSNANLEADLAINLVKQHNLDGFVVNAEAQFKAKGMNKVADTYMKRLRAGLPKTKIGLSSYRYPRSHSPFPFDEFLKYCDFSMPQVYWQGASNPAEQLRKTIAEYGALRHKLPVVPTGAAYSHGGWAPTDAQIAEFVAEAKRLGLSGANFWEWAAAQKGDASMWAAVRSAAWGNGNPPPAPSGPVYIRLKHDKQWMKHPQTGKPVKSRMEMPDWNPGFHFDVYPAVVPFALASNGGEGAFKYSRPWAQFLRASNPLNYAELERVAAGLFNPRADNQQSFPADLSKYNGDTVAEGIGATGNVYEVIDEKSGAVQVKLVDYLSTPLVPDKLNYEDTPWLMTAFTAVAKDGSVHKTVGKDVLFPNIGKSGSGWVAKERVEFFPALPIVVTVRDNLNIRSAPSLQASIVGKYMIGTTAVVTEYAPRGSNVWGKVADGRWIALVHRVTNDTLYYYTTWKMETEPPLPLVHWRPYQQKPPSNPIPQPEPQSVGNFGELYVATLNKRSPAAMLALYEKAGKLVTEDRRFAGHKEIQDWYLRMFNNKLPNARFKLVKANQNGSFYEIRWTAESPKGRVNDGHDLVRFQNTSEKTVNYHYTEFNIKK